MSDLDQSDQTQEGTLDSPKDAGPGQKGLVNLWLQSLALQDKEESKWRKSAVQTIDIYRDHEGPGQLEGNRLARYNILYSNTETMAPALYNSTPIPDVRKRYGDTDPVGKIVAQMLERGIIYSAEACEFDGVMKNAVKDVLLPGRCVTRVRYKPTVVPKKRRIGLTKSPDGQEGMYRADNGERADKAEQDFTLLEDADGPYMEGDEYDDVAYEETYPEHVQWADFRRGPGKIWDEVPWIAFRHYLTRAEVKKLNKTVGATIPLDTNVNVGEDKDPQNGTAPEGDIFKRLLVWEIWDRESRKVYFIAPSYKDAPLHEDEDPLNLKGFFPIPKPVYAVEVPETLVPVEQYKLYRDQAEELDIITRRMTALTRVIKWHGLYAQAEDGSNDLTQLSEAEDGDLVPSLSAFAVMQNGGSMDDMIWLKPIQEAASVLAQMTERQEKIKQNIYEIMGVSDIIRGSSNANETLGAQQLKTQWGSLRLSTMQQEIARYARDLMRLMAEVMAEKFSPETLMLMTDIKLPTAVEKQQAQQLLQAAEAAQQAAQQPPQPGAQMPQIPPEMLAKAQETMKSPTIEEVMEVMRSDALRCFKVDIETDSTIQADIAKQQENMNGFIGGFAQYIAAIGPAVESGAMPQEVAMKILKSFTRVFKLPREAADAIDELGDNPPPQKEDNGEAMKAQAEQARTQVEMQRTQLDGQIAQQKGQMEVQRMELDAQLAQQEHQYKMLEMQTKHQIVMAELAAKAAMPVKTPDGAANMN